MNESPDPRAFQQRQASVKRSYRDDPTLAAQTTVVRSVTPTDAAVGTVVIAADGDAGFRIEIGAHHSVGGDPALPCSGDVFLSAYLACYEITLRLVAQALNIPLHRVALRMEGDWDARGTLALDREVPVEYTAIRLAVDVETTASDEQVARLLTSAERYCVVGSTLKRPPAVEIEANVTHRA